MTEFIAETQKVLGAVITTPKLTEKLLGKPPFRFLHDIVTSFIKTTNFPEGYYSEDMLDSSKVTDKEHKLEFMMKLINVVQVATGKMTTCHPGKTIAGQEPEGTNNLLQLLASCAGLSQEAKSNAVKKALGGGDDDAEEAEAARAAKEEEKHKREKERKNRENEEKKEREEKEKNRKGNDERNENEEKERKSDEKRKGETETKERDERKKKERDEKEKPAEVEKAKVASPVEEEEHYQSNKKEKRDKHSKQKESELSKSTKLIPGSAGERPGTATARKPPPVVRSNTVEEETRVENPTTVAAVIKEEKKADSKKGEDATEDGKDWMKLVEEHDTAVRTHYHGKSDAAKGYLGKEAIEARDKQAEEKKLEKERGEGGGAGIVLRSTKGKDKGSSVGDNELSHLKQQLQMLTKATNPLGKFLEAIHDDIDAMSRELEMWRMEARNQSAAANDAHRQTQESLHEVHGKIQVVEESLSNQLVRTNMLRSTILENDRVIDTMINMVVAHDVGVGVKRK
eukprot:Tbor_TRINITY_DN3745_c0_g1::TRINITY_DN3745_c0_g1_i1::g.2349::m.2349/K19680/TRAF3IP1, IFT54; TRAF3-interacting protein 1